MYISCFKLNLVVLKYELYPSTPKRAFTGFCYHFTSNHYELFISSTYVMISIGGPLFNYCKYKQLFEVLEGIYYQGMLDLVNVLLNTLQYVIFQYINYLLRKGT